MALTQHPCSQGSFRELIYVFVMLKDAGFSPDLWSYAAALQCMGHRDQDVHTIKRCVGKMLGWPFPLGTLPSQVLSLPYISSGV